MTSCRPMKASTMPRPSLRNLLKNSPRSLISLSLSREKLHQKPLSAPIRRETCRSSPRLIRPDHLHRQNRTLGIHPNTTVYAPLPEAINDHLSIILSSPHISMFQIRLKMPSPCTPFDNHRPIPVQKAHSNPFKHGNDRQTLNQ